MDVAAHIDNIIENLQLLADLGCATTTLLLPREEGFVVRALSRPTTVAQIISTRSVGDMLTADTPGFEDCLAPRGPGSSVNSCVQGGSGIEFVTYAYPVGVGELTAIIIRDVPVGLTRSLGLMEEAGMAAARSLLNLLQTGPLIDVATGETFSTERLSTDSMVHFARNGFVSYISPEFVSFLRRAFIDLVDSAGQQGWNTWCGEMLNSIPTCNRMIFMALSGTGCSEADIEVGGRTLRFRTISLLPGALLLAEDVTELRAYEKGLRIKDAAIREVHHRVKNNMQTIESMLRMQMRRSKSSEVHSAFEEAISRIGAMAAAHDLLSYSADETADATGMVLAVAENVKKGLVGSVPGIRIEVNGEAGKLSVELVTDLALAVAESVHNAIQHGLKGRGVGRVVIGLERDDDHLTVDIADDGSGLPDGFDFEKTDSMGIALIRTLVTEDMGGGITCGEGIGGVGTCIRLDIPTAGSGKNDMVGRMS